MPNLLTNSTYMCYTTNMDKNLLFISTHKIKESVISEYNKLTASGNYDCLLLIDNTNLHLPFQSRICQKEFFGKKVNCFIFDNKLHEELNLPYITYNKLNSTFSEVMWYNADYRFYYIKNFLPNYDYYWQFDYDIFCNDKSYEKFLNKFNKAENDLLITSFRQETKNSEWFWTNHIDWIYDDMVSIYGSFFPICRLKNKTIDFLYHRRLEQAEIFKKSRDKDKRWLNCEIFVPTELMNNNFLCGNIDEPNVTLDEIDLNEIRVFENPDGAMYHPIKGDYINRLNKKKNSHIKFNFLFLKFKIKQNKFITVV